MDVEDGERDVAPGSDGGAAPASPDAQSADDAGEPVLDPAAPPAAASEDRTTPVPEPSVPPPDGRASDPGRTSRPPEDDEEGRRRQRRKLEGLLRESFRRAVEKGVEAGLGAIGTGVDALEKGVEASRDTVKQASSQLRGVAAEVKLPKDAANYLFAQVDETKNVLIRAVSREVREFLAGTDIAHELQRALTSLSFEIRTEIRFVPNEKGVMKAEVKSRAVPHRSRGDGDDEAR